MIYLTIFLVGLFVGTFCKYEDYPMRFIEWLHTKKYKKEKLPDLRWKTRFGDKIALAERIVHTRGWTRPSDHDLSEYRHDLLNNFLRNMVHKVTNFI